MKKAGWIVAIAVLVAAGMSGSAASAGRLITGAQIKDRSIATRDLAMSARPKAGRVGPVGPVGPAGPAGGLSAVQTVETPPAAYGALPSDSAIIGVRATCPAGTTLVAGGYRHLPEGSTSIAHSVIWNAPAGDNTWGIILVNLDETGDELIAVAQCATGSSPAATRLAKQATSSSDFDRALGGAVRRRAARAG